MTDKAEQEEPPLRIWVEKTTVEADTNPTWRNPKCLEPGISS